MFRQAKFPARVASIHAGKVSLRYSSSSPVHKIAAGLSPSLPRNDSDTFDANHGHDHPISLRSRWNAVGNESVTPATISALLSNTLSNLGVKDFLSGQECARMVDVIRTHTIV